MSDREACLSALQDAVSRLGGYGFGAKGWAVTVVSGFVGTAIAQQLPTLLPAAALPCLFFWWLDAYYLMLERRFRLLFNRLLSDPGAAPTPESFDHRSVAANARWLDAARSSTVGGFYLALALGVLASWKWAITVPSL